MDEKTLKTDLIYAGRLFSVERIEVMQPDGKQRVRELIRHPGATALIAIDAQGMILLVRQFRIASGRVMKEIPAGTLNPAEPPEVCAVRELQEETGYKPGRIEPLGGFYVAPGYTTEYIHLFFATDLTESRLPGDEDEFIEVDRVSLADALAMIERGEIVDSKTIIGVLRYARLIGKP